MSQFLDNLISSVRSLYITILSFAVIYAYVGFTLLERRQAVSNLITVDRLLSLRYLATHHNTELKKATRFDLAMFYPKARFGTALDLQKGRESVNNVGIQRDVPMRLAPGGACDMIVSSLSSLTALGIPAGSGRFISSRCTANRQFNVFIFSDIYLVPLFFFHQVESLGVEDSKYAKIFMVPPSSALKGAVPPPLLVYVDLGDSFTLFPVKEIDKVILRYADKRFGKFFSSVESAAQELFTEREKDASYFGITASSNFLVAVGPIIFFALSFELWRRVRRLPIEKLDAERYWFGLESYDWVGRIYAYLYAVAPLLVGLMTYILFATTPNISDAFRTVSWYYTLPEIFKITPSSTVLFVVTFVLSPIQFLILIATTKRLIHIINANSQNQPLN